MKRRLARLYRRAQRALNPGTVSPREHARRGDIARDSGDWAQAREHYSVALANDPSLEAIWVQLGHAHKVASDISQAEQAYRQALLLDPANADTWLQLGHVLRLQGRLSEARESYEQSAALSPENSYAVQEAASLGASVTALRQARRAVVRATKTPRYGDRTIGTGKLLLDITGALDHGRDVAAVVTASMTSQYEGVDVIQWRDGRWHAPNGLAYDFPDSCAALIVTGPWLSHRPDHIEGVLYDARSRDIPILGGLLDLPQPTAANDDPNGVKVALEPYLAFLNEVASGAVTFLDLDTDDVWNATQSFSNQIVAIRPELSGQKSIDPSGPILVCGPENSEEMKVVKAAIELLDPEQASLFRLTDSLAAFDGEVRASGVLLAASDPGTRLCGLRIAGHGLPLALASRHGLAGMALRADMRLATRDISATAIQIKAFASLSEGRKVTQDAPPPFYRGSEVDELRKWKVRLGDCKVGARLSIIEGRDPRPITEIDSRLVIKPESLALLNEDGFSLTTESIQLGVVSGEESLIAMFLVVAPHGSDKISFHVGKNPSPIEERLSNGSMRWLKVFLNAQRISETILISGEKELEKDASKLVAVCIHPASQPNAWANFLDQVARGAYPQIKSIGRKLADSK